MSFGLLLADVDHFKRINDTFGHVAGDEVLASIGEALKEIVNPEDIVTRIGGDEFAILVEGLNDANARETGKEIQAEIQKRDFKVGDSGQSTVVTLSMGLATAKLSDSTEDVYQRADEALYRSKQLGKNRLSTIVNEEPEGKRDDANSGQIFPSVGDGTSTYEAFKASFENE